MSRTLTIVGASVRAAAASAWRAGMLVRAGDLFADTDLARHAHATRVTDYPAGLLDVVRESNAGAWMYTGALENHPRWIRRMARLRPLLGNPAEVLSRVRNPRLLCKTLISAGLRSPAVQSFSPAVPRDGIWLLKPLRSAGGANVAAWDFDASPPTGTAGQDYYLQQRIDGMPCAAVYLAAGGKSSLLAVSRQLVGCAWCGAEGFRYCGSIGPLDLASDVTQEFARIGEVLSAEFGLAGVFGIDAIVNPQGVWPVEVNPRFPASAELCDWSTGGSVVARHVEACESGRLPAPPGCLRQGMLGKAILFARCATTIADRGMPQLESTAPFEWPAIADIPAPDRRSPSVGQSPPSLPRERMPTTRSSNSSDRSSPCTRCWGTQDDRQPARVFVRYGCSAASGVWVPWGVSLPLSSLSSSPGFQRRPAT